eukprot:5596445-Alexandrium_andersonii.AAC.1
MQKLLESLGLLSPFPLPFPSRPLREGLRPFARPDSDFALALAFDFARGPGPGTATPVFP